MYITKHNAERGRSDNAEKLTFYNTVPNTSGYLGQDYHVLHTQS